MLEVPRIRASVVEPYRVLLQTAFEITISVYDTRVPMKVHVLETIYRLFESYIQVQLQNYK